MVAVKNVTLACRFDWCSVRLPLPVVTCLPQAAHVLYVYYIHIIILLLYLYINTGELSHLHVPSTFETVNTHANVFFV